MDIDSTDAAVDTDTDPTTGAAQPSPAEPRRRQLLMDLFGVMAYSELSAFERLSSDARFSPTLHDRAALGRLAVIEFEHFELVSAELRSMGVDVEAAMAPFQPSIDAFHERTRPADWYESLMKAYVTDTMSRDFYRAVAGRLDPATRELIDRVQADEDQGAHLLNRLKDALADDPRLASRLALWGRRLVGEALTQAQRVGMERSFVAELLDDGQAGGLGDEISRLYARLTANHSRRMNLLGLTA